MKTLIKSCIETWCQFATFVTLLILLPVVLVGGYLWMMSYFFQTSIYLFVSAVIVTIIIPAIYYISKKGVNF